MPRPTSNSDQPSKTLEIYFREYLQSLIDSDRLSSNQAIDSALDHFQPDKIVDAILTPALYKLGEMWSRKEVALTQIYAASRIAERELDKLSLFIKPRRQIRWKAVIGCLDSHGLGKNIVIRFLRASGAEVIDLGINVSPKNFVEAASENNVNAILVSALMFNTALLVGEIRMLLHKQGMKIPLVVGGAPFNFDENLYKKVNADGSCKNVSDLVEMIERLVK